MDSLAAALASAAAEEAAEREAAQTASQEARTMARHNSLLTLIMLFPSMEVSAVEAVLSQQKDDFAAAYNVLLCAQEKMARAALWNGSSATLSPADQLRVEKLYAMFPGLHQEIVRSAFCASGHDWSATTTALNELTKELLSLEAVELPAKPVVWHPHASPRTESAPTGDDPQPRGQRETQSRFHSGGGGQSMCPLAVQETSEEAYEAYRAAEKEILGYGDWRQVRQQAYLINTQRLREHAGPARVSHRGGARRCGAAGRGMPAEADRAAADCGGRGPAQQAWSPVALHNADGGAADGPLSEARHEGEVHQGGLRGRHGAAASARCLKREGKKKGVSVFVCAYTVLAIVVV